MSTDKAFRLNSINSH